MLISRSRRAVLACSATSSLLALAGCGHDAPPPSGDTTPALRPAGASAHVVSYHCVAGRRGSISVAVPDPRRLAEVLNPINVCEFDGGLADVAVPLSCPPGSADREVRIVAVHGVLTATAVHAACP